MVRAQHIGSSAATQKRPEAANAGDPAARVICPGGNAMAVPFDQRPDLIWFDGKLVPTRTPRSAC